MSDQEITFHNLSSMMFPAFISGVEIGKNMIPPIPANLMSLIIAKTESSEVMIKRDSEKEYIELDLDKMIQNKLYPIEYQNELRLAKKINDNQIVFYEVIE